MEMNLGTLLVLIGVIMAVIDFFVDTQRWHRHGLLILAVVLIGIGVLLGPEVLVEVD